MTGNTIHIKNHSMHTSVCVCDFVYIDIHICVCLAAARSSEYKELMSIIWTTYGCLLVNSSQLHSN